MSAFLASIGLPEIVAGIMLLALNAYALMGGADFGGGVWDLLASGPRRDAQRAQIASSLAPIWEANHVWLIVVVVLLFTGFPAAFQDLAIVLHLPLTLMLVGIVLRGSAFVFRSYGARSARGRSRWGLLFAVSSTVTPIVLGIIVGALAAGDVGAAARRLHTAGFTFTDIFVASWLGVFPILVGAFALALFSFLAAVYLAYGARDDAVRDDFRLRALGAAVAVLVLAATALLVGHRAAPGMAQALVGAVWAMPLHLLTAVAAIVAFAALATRRYAIARAAAAAQVSLILWGWALAQYPFIIPDTLTIDDAAAPRATLVLLLIGLAGGTLVLVPALRYLFALFAREGGEDSASPSAP